MQTTGDGLSGAAQGPPEADEAMEREIYRLSDPLWTLVQALMVRCRPNMQHAGRWDRRRRNLDALIHIIRYNLFTQDTPGELSTGDAVRAFCSRWRDVLVEVPAVLQEAIAAGNVAVPDSVMKALEDMAALDGWLRSRQREWFFRQPAAGGPGVPVRTQAPVHGLLPDRCPRGCGAHGPMLERTSAGDGWRCLRCGVDGFDAPGTALFSGRRDAYK